jgi:hypothetical protein
MADTKEDTNTDDSDESPDQSIDEDDKQEKTDDEDYYTESDEDEVEDNLTLAEQLEIEKRNFREARLRIGNLITQVTEYQVSNLA